MRVRNFVFGKQAPGCAPDPRRPGVSIPWRGALASLQRHGFAAANGRYRFEFSHFFISLAFRFRSNVQMHVVPPVAGERQSSRSSCSIIERDMCPPVRLAENPSGTSPVGNGRLSMDAALVICRE
jgi:hypothetical protein